MKDTAAVMKWKIIGCTCNAVVLAVSADYFYDRTDCNDLSKERKR